MPSPLSKEEYDHDWWVCACVKGGGRGKPSTHIKLLPRTMKKCRTCGCTLEQYDKISGLK